MLYKEIYKEGNLFNENTISKSLMILFIFHMLAVIFYATAGADLTVVHWCISND